MKKTYNYTLIYLDIRRKMNGKNSTTVTIMKDTKTGGRIRNIIASIRHKYPVKMNNELIYSDTNLRSNNKPM